MLLPVERQLSSKGGTEIGVTRESLVGVLLQRVASLGECESSFGDDLVERVGSAGNFAAVVAVAAQWAQLFEYTGEHRHLQDVLLLVFVELHIPLNCTAIAAAVEGRHVGSIE